MSLEGRPAGTPGGTVHPQVIPGDKPAKPRRFRGLWLLLTAPFAVLAGLYLGDLILSWDRVPRGVTAAGVPIGGLTLTDAEEQLRVAVTPRTTREVPVTAGPERAEIDPTSAGLSVDWRAAVGQAGAQPLNPITRRSSLFTTREIGVVSTADDVALTAAVDELGARVAEDPVEGTVRFAGRDPVGVNPEAGRRLDVDAATELLKRDWATGSTVDLPMIELPPAQQRPTSRPPSPTSPRPRCPGRWSSPARTTCAPSSPRTSSPQP